MINQIRVSRHDTIIRLNPYQDKFIFSTARYPAMVAAWGTGKSMSLIEKGMNASEEFPDNLGAIFRKEFTDLRDSTIKDFESYTKMTLDSKREAHVGKSTIMFRHLEELNSIQNMNLGWFVIEQGDELENDEIFNKLRGRLRRANVRHFGAVVANTKGKNWIHKNWKALQQDNFELIEARTFDNRHNLPPEFIADLDKLKLQSPKIWSRFVNNSWDDDDTQDNVFLSKWIADACLRQLPRIGDVRRIIGIDVARSGKDKTVMYAMENNRVLGKAVFEKKDTMEVVAQALLFAERHKNIPNFSVDELNAGAGVADRLHELGKRVIFVNSCKKAKSEKFVNTRAEVYGYGAEALEVGNVSIDPTDADLVDQLSWPRWKKIDSALKFQVELKEDIIERHGRSPDDLDAYLYALWGLPQTQPIYETEYSSQSQVGWVHPRFRQAVGM